MLCCVVVELFIIISCNALKSHYNFILIVIILIFRAGSRKGRGIQGVQTLSSVLHYNLSVWLNKVLITSLPSSFSHTLIYCS